jgi:type IV secretion system protein VirB8
MTKPLPETRADYYEGAASWALDRNRALERSRRIAWIVAIMAAVLAFVLGIAIAIMLPLKTVVPYTLLVERQTGFVEALDPLDASKIAPDTALTQSFLVQYVLAREGFDRATVQRDYRKANLWSADSARSYYANAMQVNNPQSPLVRLPRGTMIEARVRSVSSLGTRRALVRFETLERSRNGSVRAPQYWVAVIDYRFSTAPMSVEDRFINPLGFQVTRYSRNAEAIAPAQPAMVEPIQAPRDTAAPAGPASPTRSQ